MVQWTILYCKPIHTDLYLNYNSHHHPFNKQASISAFLHMARTLCEWESLCELKFLKPTFRQNGYSNLQIWQAINRLRFQVLTAASMKMRAC
jgi:hypothetical protein